MNIAATPPVIVTRPDPLTSIFHVEGRDRIFLRAGVTIRAGDAETTAEADMEVALPAEVLDPGTDYFVTVIDGWPVAERATSAELPAGCIGGFHYAPGGNATGREGGDDVPAINPLSCWDIGFRPACPDPRGMALVEMAGGKLFWADIYLLGTNHLAAGTSSCGATIADGDSLPASPTGKGKVARLDYAAAVAIYAHHGKQLLGAEEFFAAAYGVKERCSRDEEPTTTGDLGDGGARFISRRGLFDVTGTMWQWGTDGDPDEPRASIFGGSWVNGGNAGSRCANLGLWPGNSDGLISARGRSDHLQPA